VLLIDASLFPSVGAFPLFFFEIQETISVGFLFPFASSLLFFVEQPLVVVALVVSLKLQKFWNAVFLLWIFPENIFVISTHSSIDR